jgi:hypothetical protein
MKGERPYSGISTKKTSAKMMTLNEKRTFVCCVVLKEKIKKKISTVGRSGRPAVASFFAAIGDRQNG